MALKVNDIVRNKLASPTAAVGRLCYIGPVSSCVQFPEGCLKIDKRDLELASGSAPACTAACTKGECGARKI
jgi:hypothetical protein